jgi:hypothetical protein
MAYRGNGRDEHSTLELWRDGTEDLDDGYMTGLVEISHE